MIMSVTGLDIGGGYIYDESTGLVDNAPDHGIDVKIHFIHDPSPAPYEQTRNRNTTTFTFTENEMETVFELQSTICQLDNVVSDTTQIIKMLELAYEMGQDNPKGKYEYNDLSTTLTLSEERIVELDLATDVTPHTPSVEKEEEWEEDEEEEWEEDEEEEWEEDEEEGGNKEIDNE